MWLNNMKKAFTLVELLVCIGIIAIIGAVTIPTLAKSYDNAKEDIIEQYNGNDVRVVDIDTNEVIFEGKSEELKQNYTLIDVKYENGVVIMFVKV